MSPCYAAARKHRRVPQGTIVPAVRRSSGIVRQPPTAPPDAFSRVSTSARVGDRCARRHAPPGPIYSSPRAAARRGADVRGATRRRPMCSAARCPATGLSSAPSVAPRLGGPVQASRLHCAHIWSNSWSGFESSSTTVCAKSAPICPSMMRWSKDKLRSITCPILISSSITTGRFFIVGT